jgi:hypothetical protein
MPARTFAKLTDFYYVRLAQARFGEAHMSPWDRFRRFASGQSAIAALTVLGSLLMACLLVPAVFRRKQRAVGAEQVAEPGVKVLGLSELPENPWRT